jgi:hypothetical protein
MHIPKHEEQNELVLGLDPAEQDAFESVGDPNPIIRILAAFRIIDGQTPRIGQARVLTVPARP